MRLFIIYDIYIKTIIKASPSKGPVEHDQLMVIDGHDRAATVVVVVVVVVGRVDRARGK